MLHRVWPTDRICPPIDCPRRPGLAQGRACEDAAASGAVGGSFLAGDGLTNREAAAFTRAAYQGGLRVPRAYYSTVFSQPADTGWHAIRAFDHYSWGAPR
jgi:hypothetical protein